MQEAKLFLQDLLHVSSERLEKALAGEYSTCYIPKRNGKSFRKISIPSEDLKFVQKRILHRILYLIALPYIFYGFIRKRSIVTNAGWHCSRNISALCGPDKTRYFLKLDLKDAFPGVKKEHYREYIGGLLKALPNFLVWQRVKLELLLYQRNRHQFSAVLDQFHNYLDRLESASDIDFRILKSIFRKFSKSSELFSDKYKSWQKGKSPSCRQLMLFENNPAPPKGFEPFINDVSELLMKLCFDEGSLPQGASTSPYLLNLAIWFSGLTTRLRELAERIQGREKMHGYDFSIYADDLTFSAYFSFNDKPFAADGDLRTIKKMIIEAIEEGGHFRINSRKTRDFNSMKCYPLVTGIRVVGENLVLPKKKIRWLRSFFHHAKNSPDEKVQARVQGWWSYLHMIYGDNLPEQIARMTS